MTISIVILLSIVLVVQVLISIIIYNFFIRISKIHYIISANSMDLDRIKKELVGEESCLNSIEKKVEGIHTLISTPIVQALIEKK